MLWGFVAGPGCHAGVRAGQGVDAVRPWGCAGGRGQGASVPPEGGNMQGPHSGDPSATGVVGRLRRGPQLLWSSGVACKASLHTGTQGTAQASPRKPLPRTVRLWQWPCCSVAVFPHTRPETPQRSLLSCLKAIPTPTDKGEDCVCGCL